MYTKESGEEPNHAEPTTSKPVSIDDTVLVEPATCCLLPVARSLVRSLRHACVERRGEEGGFGASLATEAPEIHYKNGIENGTEEHYHTHQPQNLFFLSST